MAVADAFHHRVEIILRQAHKAHGFGAHFKLGTVHTQGAHGVGQAFHHVDAHRFVTGEVETGQLVKAAGHLFVIVAPHHAGGGLGGQVFDVTIQRPQHQTQKRGVGFEQNGHENSGRADAHAILAQALAAVLLELANVCVHNTPRQNAHMLHQLKADGAGRSVKRVSALALFTVEGFTQIHQRGQQFVHTGLKPRVEALHNLLGGGAVQKRVGQQFDPWAKHIVALHQIRHNGTIPVQFGLAQIGGFKRDGFGVSANERFCALDHLFTQSLFGCLLQCFMVVAHTALIGLKRETFQKADKVTFHYHTILIFNTH